MKKEEKERKRKIVLVSIIGLLGICLYLNKRVYKLETNNEILERKNAILKGSNKSLASENRRLRKENYDACYHLGKRSIAHPIIRIKK